MSFVDQLRTSRSSRVSVVHKFLTNYDPQSKRVYVFVEGQPDIIFYKAQIGRYIQDSADIHIYNCEGKAKVYDAQATITSRYPTCQRVLFFVDKDVDDIIGRTWPADPRTYTTEWYSIENYIVTLDVLRHYLDAFVKVRNIECDHSVVCDHFRDQQQIFYRLLLPIMAWIVSMRRDGYSVILNDVDLSKLFSFHEGSIVRRPQRKTLEYLHRVTQLEHVQIDWRKLRSTTNELLRKEPKEYVRGKFEGWWFLQFSKSSCEQIALVVREGGGTVKISELAEKTYIQLMASVVQPSISLTRFLDYHLRRSEEQVQDRNDNTSLKSILLRLIGQF